MLFSFNGNGDHLRIQLILKWSVLIAFIKAAVAAITTAAALLSAPQLLQLLEQFGR